MSAHEPPSDRVRLRRGAHLGVYEHTAVLDVIDAGIVAHVGVTTPQGPIVLPMAYGRNDESLYLHGSVANAALGAADGQQVCVTITVLDGVIVGRSPFHNSMQYRSAVMRGQARRVTDGDEHIRALRLISDHVVTTWEHGRAPTPGEVRRTMVLAVPLAEMSAKVRTGGPVDEADDVDGPHWGGSVPIVSRWGDPVPSSDLPAGVDVPPSIARLSGLPTFSLPR